MLNGIFCRGALAGRHVPIKDTLHTGSYFYNYKEFSAVVKCKYEFIMVDAGINGRISDGGWFILHLEENY